MIYLPTAFWSKLRARIAQTAALGRDLDDMTCEAAGRKQLSALLKAKRLIQEAEQILAEMSGQSAVEDVERNLPRDGDHQGVGPVDLARCFLCGGYHHGIPCPNMRVTS